MKPLVSIVIPAYNSAAYIAETLDSCLAQTYRPIEIIVVDDGSSDDTVAIVENYEAVRLIQQANRGPAIARNIGVQAAQGEYIKFCDSDDILHPEHVEKCMTVFAKSAPNVAVVYTRYLHINGLAAERGAKGRALHYLLKALLQDPFTVFRHFAKKYIPAKIGTHLIKFYQRLRT